MLGRPRPIRGRAIRWCGPNAGHWHSTTRPGRNVDRMPCLGHRVPKRWRPARHRWAT